MTGPNSAAWESGGKSFFDSISAELEKYLPKKPYMVDAEPDESGLYAFRDAGGEVRGYISEQGVAALRAMQEVKR